MHKILFLVAFSWSVSQAQPINYTTANAHSHNDYNQTAPFYSAYYQTFGSIEVDVFLEKNELLVAHSEADFSAHRLLEDLYLKPLQASIQTNGGYVYPDSTRKLQLMIDVKTDPSTTLNALIILLQKYPQITKCRSFSILITGRKPDPSMFNNYPSYMWFDGLVSERYGRQALSRIAMLGENFLNYSRWTGEGTVPERDWAKVQKAVTRAHKLNKKVRFWNTPDFMDVWQQLTELGVDYINTDSPRSLGEFLKTLKKKD